MCMRASRLSVVDGKERRGQDPAVLYPRVQEGVVAPTANQPHALNTCVGAICSPGVVNTRASRLAAPDSRGTFDQP